ASIPASARSRKMRRLISSWYARNSLESDVSTYANISRSREESPKPTKRTWAGSSVTRGWSRSSARNFSSTTCSCPGVVSQRRCKLALSSIRSRIVMLTMCRRAKSLLGMVVLSPRGRAGATADGFNGADAQPPSRRILAVAAEVAHADRTVQIKAEATEEVLERGAGRQRDRQTPNAHTGDDTVERHSDLT